jgi:hypothetical protein
VPILPGEEAMKDDEASMKPSKVLRAAADLLGAGWCQKYLGIRDKAPHWIAARVWGLPIIYRGSHEFQPGVVIDRVCLQGALMKAAVDLIGAGWPVKSDHAVTPEQEAMRASYGAAERAVAEEIASRTGISGTARWNDVAGRTQAEVVALVQDVAAQEEDAGR